jgi:hypothetical protein
MGASSRTVFRDIVDSTRQAAAESAWTRARQASELRHSAVAHGNRRAARKFAEIKKAALVLAACVLPERVAVSIDKSHHVGFVSIRFKGSGGLHLPPGELQSNHGDGKGSDSLT